MTYKVNRDLGHQAWGVTNPWVFANYGQPQRRRGYVSPIVFQTQGPYLKSAHLGQTDVERELLDRAAADLRRSERMEKIAIAGLALSAASLWLAWTYHGKRAVKANKRRRPRRLRSNMDPAATLRRAREAAAERDWEEVRYALADYRAWRARGGFQPRGGDASAKRIQQRLDRARSKR